MLSIFFYSSGIILRNNLAASASAEYPLTFGLSY
jgi:hypothetical protein